ncbi:hypothetical protein GCM10010082_12270 [Kushneria pakistanensis]|uniref:DUF3298 domain-containing protein n=1 Tax=Kushneria pakistanensis TaxID=1508770 RepID=A0ABQ3FFD1_9GAMM|nr:RsiV family protein [Kushneria pakistanensis]GHC21959.1 hypothetical protein GCM10010082_12270 [Kushneria pakistanensis]
MINATRYRWLAVPALLLALTACDQNGDDQNTDNEGTAQDNVSSTADTTDTQHRQEGLSPTFVNRTITAPDCEGDECASVEIHTIEFDNAPTLSSELERRLVHMGSPISDSAVDEDRLPSTVDAYAENFFNQSAQANEDTDHPSHYYASLEAKEVSRHDDLLILALQSYVMTGGAHGLPGTEYMVIDEHTRQVVSLDDMLEEGQHPVFEAALKNAWQDWQDNSEVGKTLDPINWPFSPSDNAAPLEDNMAVTYGVYDLGPYAIGQPTLTIPYSDLKGVLKPRFLPGATADTEVSK